MPSLTLRLFPDPVLRKKAQTVRDFHAPIIHETVAGLRRLIQNQVHGIGAAAPQIGISLRIAIIDTRSREAGSEELILINPEILQLRDERINREGCMSLPDYRADIKRYTWVKVYWQDALGQGKEASFKGIHAICIQHEIDHLEGRLFIDRVTSLKRDLIPRGQCKPSNKVL